MNLFRPNPSTVLVPVAEALVHPFDGDVFAGGPDDVESGIGLNEFDGGGGAVG